MREIYTSPREQNIDAVITLMAEHGIETTVTNRSNYNRPSWQRFSYTQKQSARESWAQVWITRADDYTRARELLRGLGIEPVVRFGDELAASRRPAEARARNTPNLVRRFLLALVLVVFVVQMVRYLGWF